MNRKGRGRPLRFVGAVGLGWIGLRILMVMPGGVEPAPAADRRQGEPRPRVMAARMLPPAAPGGGGTHPAAVAPLPPVQKGGTAVPPVRQHAPQTAAAPPSSVSAPPILPQVAIEPAMAALVPVTPMRHDRWQASAWLVVRPGRGIGAAPGAGQIGGSQAGARIAYRLGGAPQIAAIGRLAGPLAGRGAEAAIGVEWQLAGPIRLVAERRIGIDGTAGGTGAGVILGVDRALDRRLRIEAYGQAGVIARRRTDPYADGAARLTRAIAAGDGMDVSLGVGIWGAAQRDAQRLDLGPSLLLALPVGGTRARIALDWRQRVAGTPRPGSGLALSIGSDF